MNTKKDIHVLIAPDSFKETMSSIEVSNIIYDELHQLHPNWLIKKMPIADGGEGSLDIIVAATNAKKIDVMTYGPNNEKIKSSYAYLEEENKVIVEVANHVGFNYKNINSTPANTSTYGIGYTIKEALKHHPKEVYICLGGSITNDGGCGIACALGAKFYNNRDEEFIPVGNNLQEIKRIDTSLLNLNGAKIIGLCDVTNPLYGKNGASYVFAKQKGANEKMIEKLDKGLIHLSNVVKECINNDLSNTNGTGAAGGIGFMIVSLLQGRLQKGIETILEFNHYDEIIKDIDLVITGEGKLDHQSFQGKVIDGILQHNHHVATIAIVGKNMCDETFYKSKGLLEVYETNETNQPMEIVKETCQEDLRKTIHKIKYPY